MIVRILVIFFLFSIPSLPTWSMSFSLQERCYPELNPACQTMVLAEGPIDKETLAQFKEFTLKLPPGTWIALTSPGGNLLAGMQLGAVIRERGFNTTIGSSDYSANSCLSACAYAFLGGLSRFIPPNGRYGLHQFRGLEKEIGTSDTQKLSAVLAKYMDSMGVDRRLLDIAQLTAADRVALLSNAQAKLYRVDNLGQSPLPRWRLETSAEGRLLALNNAVALKTNLPVIIAFFQTKQSIACLIYYKSDAAESFAQVTPHQLKIEQKIFPLQALASWQIKTGGYQTNFSIPLEALEALKQLPDSAIIQVQGEFLRPLSGQTTVEMRFGVAGLRNALAVLAQGLSKAN